MISDKKNPAESRVGKVLYKIYTYSFLLISPFIVE